MTPRRDADADADAVGDGHANDDDAFETPGAVASSSSLASLASSYEDDDESSFEFQDDARELMLYDDDDDEGSTKTPPAHAHTDDNSNSLRMMITGGGGAEYGGVVGGFVLARRVAESITTSASEIGAHAKDFISTAAATVSSRRDTMHIGTTTITTTEEDSDSAKGVADEVTQSTLDDMSAVLDNLETTPSRTELALHTTPNSASARTEREQIDIQRGLCAGCGVEIRVASGLARRFIETALRPFRQYQRCEYTNEVFCDSCAPPTSFAIIPWRVLAHWDFRPRRVCASAATFLRSIETLECLKPADVNPSLYTTAPDLGRLRDTRVRINTIYAALHAKAPAVAERLKSTAGARFQHFFFDPETFSPAALRALHRAPNDVHARGRALERHLRSLLLAASTTAATSLSS